MKSNNENQLGVPSKPSFKQTCQAFCKKLLAQINDAKEQLLAEFKQRFGQEERVLRLALNEAEALAWETGYPHLVFPELALEKAKAAAKWERQQEIFKYGRALSLKARAVRRVDEGRKPVLAIA